MGVHGRTAILELPMQLWGCTPHGHKGCNGALCVCHGWRLVCMAATTWPACDWLQMGSHPCARGRQCAGCSPLRLHTCHADAHAGGGLQAGDQVTDVSAVRELPGPAARRVVPVCAIARGKQTLVLTADAWGCCATFHNLHAGCWPCGHTAEKAAGKHRLSGARPFTAAAASLSS